MLNTAICEVASFDYETRSLTDLRKSGVYRYAEDPTTQPWCFQWRIGTGPIQLWRQGLPDPVPFLEHIRRGGTVVAHNAGFERNIWRTKKPAHWPELKIEQQDDTMARALALGLPADLDTLGRVLGNKETKDREGHALMMKMSKPRSVKNGIITWWDAPEMVDRLCDYCGQDVATEREISEKLPPLSPEEQKVWQLDQVINDRGVPFDRKMIERAADLTDYAKKATDREIRRLTKGRVGRGSQLQKIVAYLNEMGVECQSFTKGDHEALIFRGELLGDPSIAELVRLRRAASKTSTSKYKRMLECICADGRIRGLLAYHGARTGRWAGRLIQPQNLTRFDHEDADEVVMLEWLIELLSGDTPIADVYDMMYFVYGDVLGPLSRALRATIKAEDGTKFVGGDFSNIEGRSNAWLAGEAWKVQAFFDYDTIVNGKRKGHDLYKLAYARSFAAEIELITKAQRQIGKVQELALGYQGSVGAFITMGANYNVNPVDIAKVVVESCSPALWDDVAMGYRKAKNKYGLPEREWTALSIVVKQWRNAHPNIVLSWWAYQDAAIIAVDNPGTIVPVQSDKNGWRVPVNYMCDGAFLYCQLPSGRVIAYASPQVEEKVEEYIAGFDDNGEAIMRERTKRSVSFWGLDSETHQWTKLYLYGGLQCENVTQAFARDLMVHSMFNAEARGYPVILTVHDELLTQVPAMFGSAFELAEIMSIKPEYARGLPLAAAAWEDVRYVK